MLLDTLRLGLQVTLLKLLIAYPLGLVFMRAGARPRAFIRLLVLLPLLPLHHAQRKRGRARD